MVARQARDRPEAVTPSPETAQVRNGIPSSERMVLITGEMVDDDGQDPLNLRPGTYTYGPARLAHTSVCRSADPSILFIAYEAPVDALSTGAN
jgi:hypothetical protein